MLSSTVIKWQTVSCYYCGIRVSSMCLSLKIINWVPLSYGDLLFSPPVLICSEMTSYQLLLNIFYAVTSLTYSWYLITVLTLRTSFLMLPPVSITLHRDCTTRHGIVFLPSYSPNSCIKISKPPSASIYKLITVSFFFEGWEFTGFVAPEKMSFALSHPRLLNAPLILHR